MKKLFVLIVMVVVSLSLLSSCSYSSGMTVGPGYRTHKTKSGNYTGRTSAPSDLTQVKCRKVKSKKYRR